MNAAAVPAGGFIARYGLVRWTPRLGRRYPRDGACEICGRTAAELAADYAEDRNRHLGVLMFDHCHAHGWVRGLLCLGCNNGMVRFERGVGAWRDGWRERLATHAARCPGCAPARRALLLP